MDDWTARQERWHDRVEGTCELRCSPSDCSDRGASHDAFTSQGRVMANEERLDVREVYQHIGRAVSNAAWLERTIVGLRARLDDQDRAGWARAEREPVSQSISVCLQRLPGHTPQSRTVDDIAATLQHALDLFETRHHLVHGLPDSHLVPGSIVFHKHERRQGEHWTERDFDVEALRWFASDLALTVVRLGELERELLPRMTTVTVSHPDGRVEQQEHVDPAHPRDLRE